MQSSRAPSRRKRPRADHLIDARFVLQNTTSCKAHFKKYHKKLWQEANDAINDATGKQTKLKPVLSEARKKEITRALAIMTCIDKEAFSVVDREVLCAAAQMLTGF